MFAEAGAFLITMVILHNYPDLCTSQFNLTLSSSLRLRALTWLSNDSSYSQVIFTPRAASSNLWYDPGSDCHQNSLQRGGCSYPWMFFFCGSREFCLLCAVVSLVFPCSLILCWLKYGVLHNTTYRSWCLPVAPQRVQLQDREALAWGPYKSDWMLYSLWQESCMFYQKLVLLHKTLLSFSP